MKLWIIVMILCLFVVAGCVPQEKVMEKPLPVQPVVEEVPAPKVAPEEKPVEAEQPKPNVAKETPKVEEFAIEGDDKGLYPSSITVKKGNKVKVTFTARSQGTYFGGLDFRGTEWGDTGKVKPGESKTVEFTATETFEFKSYWPASNKLKATGKVVVE